MKVEDVDLEISASESLQILIFHTKKDEGVESTKREKQKSI
jgi:hypothetical protein